MESQRTAVRNQTGYAYSEAGIWREAGNGKEPGDPQLAEK